MSQVLRQSTEVIVRVGPAVAVADGFTPVTTLALGTADEAEALKAAGAATTSIAANTFAAITGADGYYDLTLSATDTATVGTLDIVINDDSLMLPIFARFQVVEENVFDMVYAASGDLGTTVDAILTDTGTTLDGKIDTIDTNVDAILVDTAEIGAAGAGLTAVPWNASWDAEVQSEVADELALAITDSIPADGSIPSVKQALYMLTQFMLERSVAATTITVKKADGTTSLFTLTLDDGTTPTSITRAT